MAINTAAKRSSATFHLFPPINSLYPPDGTIGQDNRQTVANIYGGILATTPTIGAGSHVMNDYLMLYHKK